QPCLIMQYLPSKSLQSLLSERGTLDVDEVARIGAEVAGALAAAHEAGIVHRDVKPGNVLIDAQGSAKITDFGISHAMGDVTLTSTGMVTGTPAFLAPEVARGIESGFASDVFSLGATLYVASEGTPPFGTADSDNPMAVLHRVASGRVMPPQRSGPLTRVLMDMLAEDPRARPSMAQVAQALAAVHAAVTDPAAAAPTQRMDAPLPPPALAPVPPPDTTANLPPVPAMPPSQRKPRLARNVAIALLALLLLGGGIFLATQQGGSGHRAGTSTTPAAGNAASHASASARNSPPPTTPANGSAQTQGNTAAAGGSSDQAAAVADYYGLLPGNTAAAWNRLTAGYQAQTGGRANYDSFWHSFRSVDVSHERTQGGLVLADLRYTSTTGAVSTETRSFELVREAGILKIAASSVVTG
ncbi:MAG: eukaryotic-like serine/threonine-protein kinase, partial [Mycobacterium sp.]|nr:eukaryotic-like serine/threonine-protein kinase [Mycobacterium sp.]